MGAENPVRRSRTARDTAERLGISVRTVRKYIAEPRNDFEARGKASRDQAASLREQGMTYIQIAEAMGTTTGNVGRMLYDARQKAGTS